MSSVLAVSEEITLSETEQALRLFASRVERIPGVVSACRYDTEGLNEEGVRVVVADLFSSITHDVIRAKEMVYDTFPNIRFSVDIRDVSTMKHDKP